MEAGLEAGRALLAGFEAAGGEVETRIVFLTDAMPNVGRTDAGDLANLAAGYASVGVHTTFVGIGVDFQTGLVERLARVRGANYLAIHSASEFKRRLDREFDHLVTPWGYDLGLKVTGAQVDAVYGVPEAEEAKGEVLHVRTLFPAPVQEGAVKGGIILLRLDSASLEATQAIAIAAEYEDRAGRRHRAEVQVPPPPRLPEFCPSPGVRKAVLLARYARLVRTWLDGEAGAEPAVPPAGHSPWERRSRPLRVSAEERQRFLAFLRHFQAEAKRIGDPDLGREEELLSLLAR
jgi:Ca-activated chloride channel family protein